MKNEAIDAQPSPFTGTAPVPASTGREPTYLVRYAGKEGWREASEEAYHLFSEGNRRIMYAAPVAARELDADAERRVFAATINPVELVRHFATIGPIEAAFKIWLAARATAESAPASAAPDEQWQPIETAPLDGRLMLLAYEFDRPGDWRIKIGGYWDGAWEVFGASWTPTRWQPLPAAPSPVGAKEQDK